MKIKNYKLQDKLKNKILKTKNKELIKIYFEYDLIQNFFYYYDVKKIVNNKIFFENNEDFEFLKFKLAQYNKQNKTNYQIISKRS